MVVLPETGPVYAFQALGYDDVGQFLIAVAPQPVGQEPVGVYPARAPPDEIPPDCPAGTWGWEAGTEGMG